MLKIEIVLCCITRSALTFRLCEFHHVYSGSLSLQLSSENVLYSFLFTEYKAFSEWTSWDPDIQPPSHLPLSLVNNFHHRISSVFTRLPTWYHGPRGHHGQLFWRGIATAIWTHNEMMQKVALTSLPFTLFLAHCWEKIQRGRLTWKHQKKVSITKY